jgi:hypothetical protein
MNSKKEKGNQKFNKKRKVSRQKTDFFVLFAQIFKEILKKYSFLPILKTKNSNVYIVLLHKATNLCTQRS